MALRCVASARCLVLIFLYCAPVAQLDRASGYEPEGREFESPRARHSFLALHSKTCSYGLPFNWSCSPLTTVGAVQQSDEADNGDYCAGRVRSGRRSISPARVVITLVTQELSRAVFPLACAMLFAGVLDGLSQIRLRRGLASGADG